MNEYKQFLNVSSELTGFRARALDDANYPITITNRDQLPTKYYLATCKERMGAQFVIDELLKPMASKVQKAALDANPSKQGLAARALTKLWYTGVWTQPFDYGSYKTGDQHVVNATGYKRGLMWMAGQTHAMGYSELPFGYWANPPTESLDDLMKGKH